MMKYQVGDKVIIKKGLKNGQYYGNQFMVRSMVDLCGEEVEIDIVSESKNCYRLAELPKCNWTDEMFEGLANKYKVELL